MKEFERKIASLYKEDLKERSSSTKVPEVIIKHDKERRKIIKDILADVGSDINRLSSKSLYYIAWIFHHGVTISDSEHAKRYALLSFNKGLKKAGWLYAASTDRLLMRKDEPQKFGTQFYKAGKNAKWKLYKTDLSISDVEREKYGVLSIGKQKKAIEELNKQA